MVEIGAVERVDHAPNVSPLSQPRARYAAADAVAVHGLAAEFVADKPLFGDVARRVPNALLVVSSLTLANAVVPRGGRRGGPDSLLR